MKNGAINNSKKKKIIENLILKHEKIENIN